MSSVPGFVFSTSGIILSVLLVALWLLARPRSAAARRCLAVVALGYAIVSIYPVPHAIARLLGRPFRPLTRADVPPGPSVVVLLGSGSRTAENWSGDTFSVLDGVGAARTLEAYRVSRLIDAKWVISSSGRVDPDHRDQSAGRAMRDALVQLGILPERIKLEEASRTTHDEAEIVASMLPSLGVDHVIVVTSRVHMRRSLAVFRGVGIDAIPAIAKEPDGANDWRVRFLPSGSGLGETSAVVHELGGLGYYTLRGWNK